MTGIRMKEGVDVWTCPCGRVVMMGNPCGCGRTYAEVLEEREHKPRKKPERKYREPSSEGSFIKSYLFKKGGADGR